MKILVGDVRVHVWTEEELGTILSAEAVGLISVDTKRARKTIFSHVARMLPALSIVGHATKLVSISIGSDSNGEQGVVAVYEVTEKAHEQVQS